MEKMIFTFSRNKNQKCLIKEVKDNNLTPKSAKFKLNKFLKPRKRMDIEWKLTDWDFTLWPHEVVGAVTHSVAVADPLIDTCCPTICRTGNGGYKKETWAD